MMALMTTLEPDFELRPGRIRHERGSALAQVRARVRQAQRLVKTGARIAPKSGLRAHFAKGSAKRARPVASYQRRVVVKARYAIHGGAKGAPLKAHVAYLAREGKAAERGAPGLARSVDYLQRGETPADDRFAFYDRMGEGVDARAVTAGWAEDNRHFRLIVSAEDGAALGDLKPFIRELMDGLETKLGTELDWLAVDHWDTDNPHTHVLVRGRRADGEDLFIPSRLIRSGIREDAQEIATRVLGPRLAAERARDRLHDIARMGITPLDRELAAGADADQLVRPFQPDLNARLERLEAWGLAARTRQGWRLSDDLLPALHKLEAHHAVEQAMAPYRQGREGQLLLAVDPREATTGQLVHLGPDDAFGDSFLAIVETGRGELRYARLERADDLARLTDAPPGAIIAFTPQTPAVKPSDHAIARIAEHTGGIYSAALHAELEPGVSRGLLEANVRRLEAMRRMSLIARRSDASFIAGADHLKRALIYEDRIARRYPMQASVLSHWTLEEQIEAPGPTHLDRVLAGEIAPAVGEGAFARQEAQAVRQRRAFLIEEGWLQQGEPRLARSALDQMADIELRDLAHSLSQEIGKPVTTAPLDRVHGVYSRRIDLAQGRMALIEGERQAHLIAWRPALERFAGRTVEGLARGNGRSWGLSRGLGIGLPPM